MVNEQGQLEIDPKKQFIQPFELPTDQPNQRITVPAGQTRGPYPLTAQHDGPIEIFYLKALVESTATPAVPYTDYNVDFLLEHAGKRIQFMPRRIPLIACVGDGGRPYVLPETIFLPAKQSMQVTLTNNNAFDVVVEFELGGIKFYPFSAPEATREQMWPYVDRRERTYAYFLTTDDGPVALTALQQNAFGRMTMPDDADMEIFKLTAESTGPFRARIKDGRNDRAITGNKIHSSLLFGGHIATAMGGGVGGSGGIFPSRWATTMLMPRSTQITFDVDDVSNAVNSVNMIFGGRKIKYA
jgi:hypothetical protein